MGKKGWIWKGWKVFRFNFFRLNFIQKKKQTEKASTKKKIPEKNSKIPAFRKKHLILKQLQLLQYKVENRREMVNNESPPRTSTTPFQNDKALKANEQGYVNIEGKASASNTTIYESLKYCILFWKKEILKTVRALWRYAKKVLWPFH